MQSNMVVGWKEGQNCCRKKYNIRAREKIKRGQKKGEESQGKCKKKGKGRGGRGNKLYIPLPLEGCKAGMMEKRGLKFRKKIKK